MAVDRKITTVILKSVQSQIACAAFTTLYFTPKYNSIELYFNIDFQNYNITRIYIYIYMHKTNCKLCHEASSGYFKLHNTSSSTGSVPDSRQTVGHILEAIINNRFKMLISKLVSSLKTARNRNVAYKSPPPLLLKG